MSFDHDPRWTQDIVLPSKYQIRCPNCGEVAFDAEAALRCLSSPTDYEARHIPPALIATCGNLECDMCDEDFAVELKVIVLIKDMPKDTERTHWIIEGRHAWVMVVCQGLENVFRAAIHSGLALDDFYAVRAAAPEEISEFKRCGCEPLFY